ncbi:DUF1127 domain-containing protein [Mesorhizobium sp. ISC25]|uniref:DUF1127 domain-containing protein n=1 Tax=Mesorhizobium sp. ISC25 TaxID=3077335 RepID=UPI0035DDB48B
MNAKRVEPIVDALAGMAGRILASTSRRRIERQIARFSTRRLEDLGFARDWDGSVYWPSDHR